MSKDYIEVSFIQGSGGGQLCIVPFDKHYVCINGIDVNVVGLRDVLNEIIASEEAKISKETSQQLNDEKE